MCVLSFAWVTCYSSIFMCRPKIALMRWVYESHKMTLFIRSIDSKTNWAENDRAAFQMIICAPKIFYTELSPYFFFFKETTHWTKRTWTKQIHDCYSLVTRLSFTHSLTHSIFLTEPIWMFDILRHYTMLLS